MSSTKAIERRIVARKVFNRDDAHAYCHKRLAEIHADDRFQAKAADVFSNAPLALIQCDLEGREHELTKILALLERGLL